MLRKILSFLLAVCLLFSLSACGKAEPVDKNDGSDANGSSTPEPEPENPYAKNSLTGVYDLDKDKTNLRPVAVMIDNDSLAQRNSQFSVSTADIVYETEIEAGITRLMAVYQDITKLEKIK